MGPPPPTLRTTPLWRSFGHAWDGLIDAAGQRNMRIHLVAGVLAGAFATAAPLGAVDRALIILCIAAVLAAEAANTAIEAVVDLHGGSPSEAGRIAKDAAAGAVLALAAGSVAVFGLVVAGRWRALLDGWRALLLPGAAALGLATLAVILLLRPLGPPAAPVVIAGVILVTLLAWQSACPPCALIPAALVGICFGQALRKRGGTPGGSQTTVGV